MPALPLCFDTEQVACLANSTMCMYSMLLLHMYKHVYLYLWHVCIMYMVIDATWKAILVLGLSVPLLLALKFQQWSYVAWWRKINFCDCTAITLLSSSVPFSWLCAGKVQTSTMLSFQWKDTASKGECWQSAWNRFKECGSLEFGEFSFDAVSLSHFSAQR